MSEQQKPDQPPSVAGELVMGITSGAIGGAVFGYFMRHSVQGAAVVAIAGAFLGSAYGAILALRPSLPVALFLGTSAGLIGGLIFGIGNEPEVRAMDTNITVRQIQPWISAIVGTVIGFIEGGSVWAKTRK